MAEEIKRTDNKAPSLRSGTEEPQSSGRSANKARSYRDQTYKPHDPSKPGPKTIYLNSEPQTAAEETSAPVSEEPLVSDNANAEKDTSFIGSIKEKINAAAGRNSDETGSSYKKKQAQKAARNDLLKKGILALIAIIIIILIIIIIVNNSQVKDVENLTISSTATTQTLEWTGARRGLTYEVYRAEGNNGQYMLIDTLTNGENTKTYDSLTSGTLYKYAILTVKGNGTKTDGATVQSYTYPNAVNGTSASTKETENSLTLEWSLEGSTADYEIKYDLYESMTDATTVNIAADQASYDSSTGKYSYTITGLVPDETYYISMRTVCAGIGSEWCDKFIGTVTIPESVIAAESAKPMVALTFDGGPDGGNVTDRILTVLADNNSKATFFQTGVNASYYPDMINRMISEGHEIGNHTYDEAYSGEDLGPDEIINANAAIEDACGIAPKLFRAPRNEVTDTIRETCEAEGMAIIQYNFDSHDWEYYDPQEIIDRIEQYVEDGDIIQFRNVYDETATAIEELVPYLVGEGYQLVTVTELLQAKTGQAPEAGKVYYSASDHE